MFHDMASVYEQELHMNAHRPYFQSDILSMHHCYVKILMLVPINNSLDMMQLVFHLSCTGSSSMHLINTELFCTHCSLFLCS